MKKFHRQWEKLIFWYPCCLFEFFQAPEALFQFSFHVVVHATLVLGFLLTLEEKHNSSPLLAIGAFIKNGFWDRISVGSASAAVLDMVLFEPLVWEFSPFAIFNRFDHSVDIKILVIVDDSEFLENAGSISELGLILYGFLLQFFGQAISKLKYIIGSTFVFVVHECFHHLFHHFVFVVSLFVSHVSEWGFNFITFVIVCVVSGFVVLFVEEKFLHHGFHHHFLEHVFLRLRLLSKNKLNSLRLTIRLLV